MESDARPGPDPTAIFHRMRYLRSDFRRLEHLATLGLPIAGRTVLEAGAGIGDLTSFFLDRDCTVTSVEARAANVACFRARYAEEALWPPERLRIVHGDILDLDACGVGRHDVVFCYSTLNFVADPEAALQALAERCDALMILEAAVDSGAAPGDAGITWKEADASDPGGTLTGRASLPTRRWIHERLTRAFAHVYMPRTVPAFERYRLDWSEPASGRRQDRVIFVASRLPLENALLEEGLPERFRRAP